VDDTHWWRELERPGVASRVQIVEGGPVYVLRLRHDKAYFHRRREDGTLELLVFPHDHPICGGHADDCSGGDLAGSPAGL
jgi:hypothetical protein